MDGRAASVIAAQRSYCDANPEDADGLFLLARMLLNLPGSYARDSVNLSTRCRA